MSGVGLGAVVVYGAHDHRAGPRCSVREGRTFQLAGVVAGFEVAHVAGVTGGNPLWEKTVLCRVGCGGDSGEVESDFASQALDLVIELEMVWHGSLRGFG